MSRATDDMLDTLHLITAEKLAQIIKDGVEVFDKEGNSQGFAPAPAAYIAAAIKFLKDNDITATLSSDRMKNLNKAVSQVPVFDDDYDDDRPQLN